MQIPEFHEPTPEQRQRRNRAVVLSALLIGGIVFYGGVIGIPGGGDEPSQKLAIKSVPNTDAILAADKVKAERAAERAERRAVRRRKKANEDWKRLKDQYDAMQAGGGTTGDPGADQPSQPSTPAPAQSSPTPQPTTPQAPAQTPAPPSTPTPQPTTPAQPASGGSGDPRYYGIP